MDSIQLSKLDNLLSRIDETNNIVFLKKDEKLERITFQNLFEGVNFFQLCLRSQREEVFLNLHVVLELSPLLAKLVDDLRHCCLSPHDQVDVCLDQFPPHLLNIFKDLLEKGECAVQSRDEEKQLETLLLAMGMDSSLELYRRIRVEKPPMDVKSRKRKKSGEHILREFKLRQCLDCKQPFSAGQSHICLISLDSNMDDDQDELVKNVQSGQDQNGMAVEITDPARMDKVSKDIDESDFEDEQNEFKTNEYESKDMACPRCGKVYTKGGASKVYFKRHVQSCLKRKYNHDEKIGINKNYDEKLGIDKNENQVDSHTEMNKQSAAKSRESTLYEYVPKLKIHQKEPRIEKESKECPSCGKCYVIKGRGANRALAMYDIHVSKCDGGDYDISCVDPDEIQVKDNQCKKCGKVYHPKGAYHFKKHIEKCNIEFKECTNPDEILIKDNQCNECGKVYNGNGAAYYLKKHIKTCNIEFKECAKCRQNCNGECKKCDKCGKTFKANAPVYHFQNHIQQCKGKTSTHDQKRKTVDSESSDIMQCKECNSIFVGYDALNKHKQKCSEVKEKYPCRYGCDKKFANEKLLKLHSWKWNCPVLNVSECQNMLCQLCGEGEFSEDDLYLHLYIRHEDLRRKIQKEITKKIDRFYFMEKEKMNCICPICGEEMRANRHSFGKHWAVQHKQMKKFYLSLSNNTHNNGTDYVEKESEHVDMDKIEIEDYEEDVDNDQETVEGYNSPTTKKSSCSSSNKLDSLSEEEPLLEGNSKMQDMEENDPLNMKSLPKMIIRNGWQIEMLPKKSSTTHEFVGEEKDKISKKLPTSIEKEISPKIVSDNLGTENDFQEASLTAPLSRIEEKDSISEKLPTSVEYEYPPKSRIEEKDAISEKLPTCIEYGSPVAVEKESSSTPKSRIEEKDPISEKSPSLSRVESPPQIIITNVREIENEKFENQSSITDELEIVNEQEEHEPSITLYSGIEGVKLISDSRLEDRNNDGEGRKDLNYKRSIRNELLSESESDN